MAGLLGYYRAESPPPTGDAAGEIDGDDRIIDPLGLALHP
jgi:hypothetical protein